MPANNLLLQPEVELDGRFSVELPDSVRHDLSLMRWLSHRIVDLLTRHNHIEWLVRDVEHRLGSLSASLAEDAIRDLVAEARAHRAEAPPDKQTSTQPPPRK